MAKPTKTKARYRPLAVHSLNTFTEPWEALPTHLRPYLGSPLPDETDNLALAVVRHDEGKAREISAVEAVLNAIEKRIDPPMIHSPMGMALASALTRGSRWCQKNQERILATILESSEASYADESFDGFVLDKAVRLGKKGKNANGFEAIATTEPSHP